MTPQPENSLPELFKNNSKQFGKPKREFSGLLETAQSAMAQVMVSM